jgi:hypothetical protein
MKSVSRETTAEYLNTAAINFTPQKIEQEKNIFLLF